MTKIDRYPSYAACVADALSASDQPLTVDVLLSQIARRRPLGKGARSAVYRAINKLFQAVPVAPGRYGWLSHLLNDSVIRHPLTSEETRRGFLLLDELEHMVFYPQFFQTNQPDDRTLTIELFGGPTIHAEASIERKTWSLRLGPEFGAWIDMQGGQSKDDLLIFARDAAAGHYMVRLNLREMRDERAIRQRNIQLALLAEEIVAEDRRVRMAMPTWELVARLVGRGFFHEQPAADDLHYVLHEFSMLRFRDGMGYQLPLDDDATLPGQTDVRFSLPADAEDLPDMDDEDDEEDWSMLRAGDDPDALTSEEGCASYQAYLETFLALDPNGRPLPHEDFHLLEAELELLARLEQEFGRLLPDQAERKELLASMLFIDPNEFLENGWDMPEDPDVDNPPFWAN
ncbi:MAG: hypothetical protein IT329_12845 [Caldilineaceae bacterium]|nr:hypothetical protein [Caldilineaceae bacterium]